jgi:GT2 family glycosyltransferase
VSRSHEWPIGVRFVDVDRPLAALTGLARYSRIRVFVSRGEHLLGSVDIWHRGAERISVERLQDEIAHRLARELLKLDVQAQLAPRKDAVADPSPGQSVSVIVPTCGRSEELRECLASLRSQRTRHVIEIVVVDNTPSGGTTTTLRRQFPTVRVVHEPRPGLSFARNTGIAHSTGNVIVTTDDDVVAPDTWIEKLLAPFARQNVTCVTGHVLPRELETEAQCRFEAYGGLGKGFARREVDGSWFRSWGTAVPTWTLGATANAAFRRSIFEDPRIGPLDEALGAGTPTGCSEDTLLFYRILKANGTIVYEPSAFVWHRHRASMSALRRQIFDYSKGHVAYQLTTMLADGDRRAIVRLCYSLPRMYLQRALQRARRHSEYPLSLIALEVLGNLAGPWALWRSRRRARRLAAAGPAREHTGAVSVEGHVT